MEDILLDSINERFKKFERGEMDVATFCSETELQFVKLIDDASADLEDRNYCDHCGAVKAHAKSSRGHVAREFFQKYSWKHFDSHQRILKKMIQKYPSKELQFLMDILTGMNEPFDGRKKLKAMKQGLDEIKEQIRVAEELHKQKQTL